MQIFRSNIKKFSNPAGILVAGIVLGLLSAQGVANLTPPTEHKGLEVKGLGEIGKESLSIQLGLKGYKLQLREISIMPGGQIARHSHSTRPGIVKVINGTWTEGRTQGNTDFNSESAALLEDSETEHWFYNHGNKPATAYVCDIVADDS